MAKKESFDFDDWDDWEDFEDFNDGLGEGDFKSTTKAGKAREAVVALSGGLVSGVKESLFSRSFYQSVVSNALPDEYSVTLDAALNIKDTVEDVYDTAIRESENVNDKLTKGVKPFVDKYSDKLPLRLKGPLRKWTSNVRSTNEWSQENKEELESVATINDIFNKRDQTKSLRTTSIQSQVQTGLAKGQLGLTSQMAETQQRMLAYQDQIDANWKRKTLELQYKQFFVQRKMLDVQQQHLKHDIEISKALVRNTGLPDFIKAQEAEIAGRIVKEKLYGYAFNKFSGLPTNVAYRLGGNLLSKLKSKSADLQATIGDTLENAYDKTISVEEDAEYLSDRERFREGGNLAGGILSEGLGGYVAKKFQTKIARNAKVQHGANLLGGITQRLPRIINTMIRNGSGSGLADMLLELMDADQVFTQDDMRVMGNHSNNLEDKAYYDLLSKKSLTEIIPGYLTRIHHEIRSIRTGDDTQPMLAFDFDKGVFSNESVIKKRLKEKVIGNVPKTQLKRNHDDVVEKLGLNDIGDPEIAKIFLEEFSMAALNNEDFTLSSLLNSDYGRLDGEQAELFKNFLKTKFNIENDEWDDYLNRGFVSGMKKRLNSSVNMSPAAAKAQRDITDSLTRLQRDLNNPTQELTKSASQGRIDIAHSLGLTEESGGVYSLDKRKYLQLLMQFDEDYQEEEEEKEEEEDSATKRYLDELAKKVKGKVSRKGSNEDTSTDSQEAEGEEETKGSKRSSLKERAKRVSDKTKDLKDNVKEKVSDVRNKSKNDVEQESKRKERRYKSFFNERKLAEYKARFGVNDGISRLMDYIKERTGKEDITSDDIAKAYEEDYSVREMVDDIEAENEAQEAKAQRRIFGRRNDKSEKRSFWKFGRDKDSVKKTTNKPSTNSEPTEDDLHEAEAYAEDFIKQNDIADETGSVKQSLTRAYLKDRFMGSRWYAAASKVGHLFSDGKQGAKIASDRVRSVSPKDKALGVVEILFELSKYGAKAASIGAQPGLAAMKLIPWGLKKIVGLMTDVVNFQGVQHALWLKGEDEPRLLKTGLMNGRYINGDGDVIEKPSDLKGDIYDGMTTPHTLIMTKSEYKGGLYDSTGKLIYKPPSILKRVGTGIAKLPWKLAKGTAKIAGKAFLGYLKITTKPVTWMINRILREDRIEPKLHAELVHLGLTEQTNQRLEQLSELIDERMPGGKAKYNDRDGDGHRDGSFKDVSDKRKKAKEEREEKRIQKRKEREEAKKNKKKDNGPSLVDNLMGLLGKGKGMIGGLLGSTGRLLTNPYVLGAVAISSLLGWEFMRDGAKSKDKDDIAQQLPDSFKDSKAARIGIRVTEKIVDTLVLGPMKTAMKGALKSVELTTRLLKWSGRKLVRGMENTGRYLGGIPGRVAGFFVGDKAKRTFDKLLGLDNINPLFRFRMAQYGFDYNDRAAVNAILKLEDDILKTLIEATDNKGARIDNSVTIEQSAAYFGVSINSEENLAEWIAWFRDRFRPVFLSSVTILKRAGHVGRDLHQVDATLTKDEKLDFINKVNFYRLEDNPYDAVASPIGSESKLKYLGTSAVNAVRKEQIAEIKKMPDDPKKLQQAKERAAKRDGKRLEAAKDTLKDVKPNKRFDPYKAVDKITYKNHLKATNAIVNKVTGNTEEAPGENGKKTTGGGGAGGNFANAPAKGKDGRTEEQRKADFEKHGLVGEMATKTVSALGSLFVKQAHASTFMPEVQYGGAAMPLATAKGGKMVLPNQATPNQATKAASTTKGAKTATKVQATMLTPSGIAKFRPNSPSGSTALGVHDRPVRAATFARGSAKTGPSGMATKAIKEALNKAGYNFKAPAAACDYPATALPDMGYVKIDNDSPWIVGDIMVYTSSRKYSQGHIQIYDGANWISDHIQTTSNPFPDGSPTFSLWRDVKFSKKGTAAPKEMALSNEVDKALEERNLKLDKKGDLVSKNKPTNTSDSRRADSKPEKKEKGAIGKAWDKTKDVASGLVEKIGNIGSDIADKIKGFFSGGNNDSSAPADSGGSGGGGPVGDTTVVMSATQKQWQMMVYKAMKNAGFSEQQSRILTAEIGRENSYNPDNLFGGHSDPHKGQNLGMMSWQGTRRPRLVKFLKEAGVLNANGTIQRSQAALDVQARFMMHELKGPDYPKARKFLDNPNISYREGVWIVGKHYILWRIDDPKYAAAGARNRDGFYNMLLQQLGAKDGDAANTKTSTTTAPAAPVKTKAADGQTKVTQGKTASSTSTNTAAKAAVATTKSTAATPAKTTTAAAATTAATTEAKSTEPKNQTDSGATSTKSGGNSSMPAGAPPIKAAQYARRNAARASKGQCAKYVRLALQSAGYTFTSQTSAYMYANGTLSSMGYGQISTSTPWQVGDIVVIKNSGRHPHGHICIWDGSNWISDFVQSNWNVYRGEQFWTLWRDRRYLAGAQASTGPTSSSTGKGAGPGAGGGGDGASSTPQYATVKMKYSNRNSAEIDARIKDTWNSRLKGIKTKDQIAREGKRAADKATAVSATADTAAKTAQSTKTTPASTTNPAKPTPTTKPPVGSSFAPSLPFGAQSLVDTGSSRGNYDLSTVNPLDWLKQQQVEERTNKTLTEKMSEAAVAQSNADIAESSKILRESLMVQTRMLDKLTSIEAHMVASARREVNRNITESSGTAPTKVETPKATVTPKPEFKVERPGRNEPMSMSKIQ